ncbi:hypothetical protein [Streptomyces endophytica]|uniref:Uncharacterized protein n=1 Tax=Streptomyces endophytica TaxID=2991496 RepID=A0ABY6P9N7_9ACTN|nr:hypothetical protein [Streptomyces endophytica]UZJ30540.1 hypothetical protein OJ254_09470 [Streptomyces endophytica]
MTIYLKRAGMTAAVITAGTMAATLGLQTLGAQSAAAAQPTAAERPMVAAAGRSASETICIPTFHRGD